MKVHGCNNLVSIKQNQNRTFYVIFPLNQLFKYFILVLSNRVFFFQYFIAINPMNYIFLVHFFSPKYTSTYAWCYLYLSIKRKILNHLYIKSYEVIICLTKEKGKEKLIGDRASLFLDLTTISNKEVTNSKG